MRVTGKHSREGSELDAVGWVVIVFVLVGNGQACSVITPTTQATRVPSHQPVLFHQFNMLFQNVPQRSSLSHRTSGSNRVRGLSPLNLGEYFIFKAQNLLVPRGHIQVIEEQNSNDMLSSLLFIQHSKICSFVQSNSLLAFCICLNQFLRWGSTVNCSRLQVTKPHSGPINTNIYEIQHTAF